MAQHSVEAKNDDDVGRQHNDGHSVVNDGHNVAGNNNNNIPEAILELRDWTVAS